MPKHAVSKNPVPDAKAAFANVMTTTAAEMDVKRQQDAAEAARRAEWNKPENVRARLIADIEGAAKKLPVLLAEANKDLAAKIREIEGKTWNSPDEKSRALRQVRELTMTGTGEVVEAELKEYPVRDPANVYLSFNNGTFFHSRFGWDESPWGDYKRLEEFLGGEKVQAETAAIRKFMGVCQKHNIGVKVSLMPAATHTYEFCCEDNWVTDERRAGIFVQVFPLKDFDPQLLPKALVPRKPRAPRQNSEGPAVPELN